MGTAKEYPYDPKVAEGTKVFLKPTPLPPDRREWVRKEMEKLEKSGVVKRVEHCECAVNVVLVE